jgi:hypothetical protein
MPATRRSASCGTFSNECCQLSRIRWFGTESGRHLVLISRLNRDRIRQRRPAFCGHTTQKVPVLIEPQVVVCLGFAALLPNWIVQAGFVLALPRTPELHDNVLCAGGRECAIRLTRSADHALAGRALLRANDLALSAVPDLSHSARLPNDCSRPGLRGDCSRAGCRTAGAIFALRLSRRTRLARSAFARLAAQVGCDQL